MVIGESWTNAFGERVTLTERGLQVAGTAQNAAAPRTIPAGPATPRVPTPPPKPKEPVFLEPVPYWTERKQ